MSLTKMLGTFILLGLIVSRANASDTFTFSDITLKGSGCPSGTFSVVKSPDNKEVSILFDNFTVEVPQYNDLNDNPSRGDEKLDQKICDIFIEALLPAGERIDTFDISVDYRGAASLEVGSSAFFKSMLMHWNGPSVARANKRTLISEKHWQAFSEPLDDDWTVSKSKRIIGKNNSCAKHGDKKVQFVLKSILSARLARRAHPDDTFAFVTMDSSDIAGELGLKLKTKKCNGNSGNGRGRGHGRGSNYNPPGNGSNYNPPGNGRGNGRGRGNAPGVRPGLSCPSGYRLNPGNGRCLRN